MKPELVLSFEELKRRFVNKRVNEELEKMNNDKAENSSVSEEFKVDNGDIIENIDIIQIGQEEKILEVSKSYIHKKFRIRSYETNFHPVKS